MKVVLLLVVVLTAMFTANCRDQVNNIEDQLFPDEPVEDYIFPDGQVDDAFIGEAQHVSMGSENQNIGEEVQQRNKNFHKRSISDHRASMNERGKKCTPSPLCTRAGGHCVKKRGDCNGLIDRNGCKGNKKCQCCIPDDIICGPAPTTVVPTTTMDSTTTIPTTTTTTTPTTTTTASTTTTPGCRNGFFHLGTTECFKYFRGTYVNWTNAQSTCAQAGLYLAEPSDQVAANITRYLIDTHGSSNYAWLGARVVRSTWTWERKQTTMVGRNPLWWGGSIGIWGNGAPQCLMMSLSQGNWNTYPGQVYLSGTCSSRKEPICQG